MPDFQHISVLLEEAISALELRPGLTVVDATLGGGGHTSEILKRITPGGKVIAFDQDALAVQQATIRFAGQPVQLIHANFSALAELSVPVDRILFDLGVSSPQLDMRERGFTWKEDAPLDMRMDQRQTLTAEEIVNTYPEELLADIIFEYGEERYARRVAKGIVYHRAQQRIVRSDQLKTIVVKSVFGSYAAKTASIARVFQSIRIAVNNELGNLKNGLSAAINVLAPGGRIVVISFHSLEDRIVKQMFAENVRQGILSAVLKKPLQPTNQECSRNPRARSAKLRWGVRHG
jgi:16S rRNA (cytosine1402-N4)-methyltransferase